jgi:pimeloyl-ACP methyl ester carboxylesterase
MPRIGPVSIEAIAAESPKFTAPMVLVHGLWCTPAAWRRFMGYLAHRGWSCMALDLHSDAVAGSERALSQTSLSDYATHVRQVIAACDAPPVLLGHDLGGLLVLRRDLPAIRAVVALAPLIPRPISVSGKPALTGLISRLALWRGRPLPPPRGKLAAAYFATAPPGGTTSEPAALARELRRDNFPLATIGVNVPALVLAAERDVFSMPSDVRRLAEHAGATFRLAERAGHAMPWEPGWERRVSEIHRWLIQTLGDPLLAMHEAEEEKPEPRF